MTVRSFALAIWGGICLFAAGGARCEQPPHLSAEESAFIEDHADHHLVQIVRENDLDLRFDPRARGISGRWTSVDEFWVRDERGVQEISRQSVYFTDVYTLKNFDVEVLKPDGKSVRHKRKKLDWIALPTSQGLIYDQTATSEYAVITGVEVGDRVRVRTEYELRGVHGVPRIPLGVGSNGSILLSSIRVRHPKDHGLRWDVLGPESLKGALKFDGKGSEGGLLVWELSGVKCRRPEPLSPELAPGGLEWVAQFTEVGRALDPDVFAVGNDWSSVGEAYLRRIDGVFAVNPAIQREAEALVEGVEGGAEKIARIYEAVQSRCRYLGLYDGLGGIIPEPAALTLERRYGDCKGLSVLLITMLRAVGIEAHPVLALTASGGVLAREIANMTQFNHFLVWADDGEAGMWLDPTYDFCPAGLVPMNDAASPVLLLEPGAIGLVDVSADPGWREFHIKGRIDAARRASFEIEEVRYGHLALQFRLKSSFDEYPASLLENHLDSGVDSSRVDLGETWSDPTRIVMHVTSPKPLLAAAGQVYLPQRLLWHWLPEVDADHRQLPFDTRDLFDRVETWRVALPSGWVVSESQQQAEGEFLSWSHAARQEQEFLVVERSVRWKRGQFPATVVARFKEEVEALRTILDGYLTIQESGSR